MDVNEAALSDAAARGMTRTDASTELLLEEVHHLGVEVAVERLPVESRGIGAELRGRFPDGCRAWWQEGEMTGARDGVEVHTPAQRGGNRGHPSRLNTVTTQFGTPKLDRYLHWLG